MRKLIYVADDEESIRRLIEAFLVRDGFDVSCFETGEALLQAFEKRAPDLVLLDIMMPGMDGLAVCSQLREKSEVPIIMISAKGGELDRVTGITLGGDDYLVKPFSMLELVARIHRLLSRVDRRAASADSEALGAFGDLVIDPDKRAVALRGAPFPVTPTEFDFLLFMIENQHRAVGRKELLKKLWQFDFDADTRATDDLVKRLRKKLATANSDVQIETVWGFGYRLAKSGDVL